METYTLNRFYFEAKALLEKYAYHVEGFITEVSFTIGEGDIYSGANTSPKLRCGIYYRDKNHRSSNKEFYINEPTPVSALSSFEEGLQQITGKGLIERVAIESEEPQS